MGVARLADLSAEWSHQRQMLGLPVLQPSIEPSGAAGIAGAPQAN
jgi:hypothetical protein